MIRVTEESYTVSQTTVTGAPCSEDIPGMGRVTEYRPQTTWAVEPHRGIVLPPLTDDAWKPPPERKGWRKVKQ